MDRRTFVYQSGTLLAGTLVAPNLMTLSPGMAKKKIAMVGTGDRGTSMWGIPVIREFGELVEFVGLCDTNPGRLATAKTLLNVTCPHLY